MSLIKKFLSFSIGGYIGLLIGLLTTPIVTRLISPEEYGVFSIYNLTLNILMLFVMIGLDQGFVRFFYEENSLESRSELLKKTLKLPLILFTILSIIFFLTKDVTIKLIFGNLDASNLTFYILIGIIISLINRFSTLVIRMQQKGKLFSIIQVLNQIFNFLFIILLYKIYGNSYKVLIISLIGSSFLIALISLVSERKVWFSKKGKSKTSYKTLLEYSYPIAITVLVSWLFQSADKLFIKNYTNLYELGLYAAAFKIISLLNVVQNGFNTFWIPISFEKYQENKENKKFFEDIFNLISLGMLLLGIGILLGKDILILILGEKFKGAVKIFPALIMIPLMNTASEVTVVGINFRKKTKYHLIISVLVTISNLIGNYLLVPKLGAVGAAISTGFSYIVFFLFRTYLSKKVFDCNYKVNRFILLSSMLFAYSIYISIFETNYLSYVLGIALFFKILIFYRDVIKNYIFLIKNKSFNLK
ncbi:MAG: oligosaccharide flippase family protein [Fusobacteriaceae bacterium]